MPHASGVVILKASSSGRRFDLASIRLVKTHAGHRIRFATNRRIRFAEAYGNTQRMAYDLTTGEFDLNDANKDKSTGVLYPASQLIINKKGELQFELRKNPWKLVNNYRLEQAGSEARLNIPSASTAESLTRASL